MKVLITTGIYPPDIGGPATYVPLIAEELLRRGYEVGVVCLSDLVAGGEAEGGVDVGRVARRQPLPLRAVRTVARIIRSGGKADVIFANGLYFETAVANIILKKPVILKVVGDWAWERATNHNSTRADFEAFEAAGGGPLVRLARGLRSLCVRRADAVIVPSEFLARAVVRWGAGEERVTVIHNAADLPEKLPAVDMPLSQPVRIVTVGRLVRWKHVDRVLAVLAGLRGVGLLVVGDGPERGRLEALAASLAIADRVRFCGSRSREETLALMSRCDAMVLNSTYEGLPHVVLEAMALGLPVIATAAGGTGELVRDGENGRLVPPLDNHALREALAEVAASPAERRRLAGAAALTVRRFERRRMVEKTQSVIARAVNPYSPLGVAVGA